MASVPGESSRPARARFATYALAVGLAIATYLPGLPGELVYDDHRLIADNEGLRRPFDVRRAFLRDYYASDVDGMGLGYYRPIAILSNELDFRRGAGSPLAFHLTNILLHAACTAWVVALARRCAGGGWVAPAIAGTLFALHPAHAESVAFISGRVDPLATLFGMATILLHLKGLSSRRPWRWRLGAALAWLAALLSKEIAITIPVLALCAEVAQDGSPRRGRAERFLPYLVALVAYLALRWTALGSLLGTASAPVGGRLVQLPVVLGSYIAWLVLPPPGIHLEPTVASGTFAVLAVGALAAALGVMVACLRRGDALVSAFVGWCIFALLPVAQIRPLETELSERFLYLPSVGACVLAGVLVGRVRSGVARKAAIVAACAIAAVYAAILLPRVVAWRDPVALWSAKAREDPSSLKAQLNLGRALAARGEVEGARRAYERAVALDPDLADTAVAEFQALSGAEGGASADTLRRALAAAPQDASLWNNLGFRLLEDGDPGGASEAFTRAVTLVPADSTFWLGLALSELRLGRLDRAMDAATRSVALNPEQDLAKMVRAECFLRTGSPCDAIRELEGTPFDHPEDVAARDKLLKLARQGCVFSP